MADPQKRKLSWKYLVFLTLSLVTSYFVADKFSDRLLPDGDEITVLTTIFSIFAGVIIAIISILGDPSMVLNKSWRHSRATAKENQRKLHRHADVFILYVVILTLIFIFSMSKATDPYYALIQWWTLFLSTLGLFASLSVPLSLISVQKARLLAAIREGEKKAD